MRRASFVAILALIVSGSAAIGCTNSPDDFGGGSSGTVSKNGKKRESNPASGDIGGDPQTPSEEPLSGDPAADPGEDPAAPADPAPAQDPDPNVDPDPNPNPNPNPNPVPAGSFAIGTQLVNTANLNIREGADTTFAIITTAPKDSTLTVVSVSGATGWVNVSWNGNVGWSSKAYLAVP